MANRGICLYWKVHSSFTKRFTTDISSVAEFEGSESKIRTTNREAGFSWFKSLSPMWHPLVVSGTHIVHRSFCRLSEELLVWLHSANSFGWSNFDNEIKLLNQRPVCRMNPEWMGWIYWALWVLLCCRFDNGKCYTHHRAIGLEEIHLNERNFILIKEDANWFTNLSSKF